MLRRDLKLQMRCRVGSQDTERVPCLRAWASAFSMKQPSSRPAAAAVYLHVVLNGALPRPLQCEQCANVKYVRESETLTVQVDPGMREGQVRPLTWLRMHSENKQR